VPSPQGLRPARPLPGLPGRPRRGRVLRAAAGVAPVALLALAGCGGPADASADGAGSGGAVAVAATDSTCQVATTSLPAGTHRFEVTNKGSRVTEFEVLAGEKIVAEVENISPGTSRTLLADLAAGSYQAACLPGMVGDGIRSTLTVSGAAQQGGDDQRLTAAASAYTGYVRTQVAALQQQTAAFADAVKAGDVARAQALYPVARTSYERVEPVAESFGDLDPEIDARENDVEEGQTWTGFHVLEKTLWTGGDLTAAGPVADELVRDVGRLADQVQTLHLAPLDMANGALGLLDEIAKSKVTGEEDRYSHTDLWDFSANLEGSQQAVESLRPVIAEHDPALATALDQQFAATRAALDQYRQGNGFRPYTDLTADQTRGLSDAINALAAQVSKVPAVIATR
jgi:iron uptake system component EfeO